MSILVVGSVAFDDLETPYGKRKRALGGAATHFSAAASFFTDIKMVAVVGNDFDKGHIDFLKSRNICIKGLQVDKNGKTFYWKGCYGEALDDAKSLDTQLGVFANFKPKLSEEYRNSEFVFLAAIHPELQMDVLDQVNKPKLIACDTRELWLTDKMDLVKKVIKRVDILLINDREARLLSGEHNLVKAAAIIRKIGPKILVIKKGEHGALLFTKDNIFYTPAMPLEDVKDPTGAGDTFAGGFLGYLAKTGKFDEAHLKRAMVYGSAMASFNVEDFSLDRLRTLTMNEIEGRAAEFKKLSHFDL